MVAETVQLPSTYGRYQIHSELGRGAMGVVYKARDPQIDRWVALKVLNRRRTISNRSRASLLKEARAIGRLSHPNIVTVFDVGQDHGTVFLAEEYVDGHSLYLALKNGAQAPMTVVAMGLQLGQALAYAHGAGIVHRDIKSHNIICQSDNRVKLTDFGIARIEGAQAGEATHPGKILGTPAYMAPELLSGAAADPRSDIFSLGVVLYEAATGRRPFQGESLAAIFGAIREQEPQPPGEINDQVPADLSAIIMACLAKVPTERLQNGEALVQALRGCLPDAYTRQPSPASPASPGDRRRWWLPLIFVILAAMAGTALWILPRLFGETRTTPEAQLVRIDVGIDSDPPGAKVFIDGQLKGQTPIVVRLSEDEYRLRLEADGFYVHESILQVDGESVIPTVVKLKPLIF